MHTKTLIIVFGSMVGVVCAIKSSYGTEIAIVSFVLGLLQGALFLFGKRREQKREVSASRFSLPLLSSLFFLAVAFLIVRVQFVSERHTYVCSGPCSFVGTIIDTPEIKNDYQVMVVKPDTQDNVYHVQVRAPLYPRYGVGEVVMLSGKVSVPQTYVSHEKGSSFDYGAYLRMHAIGSEMFFPKIVVVENNIQPSDGFALKKLREKFVVTITEYVDEPSASLATGMLFGETSMSKEIVQTFRVAGLSHIVVLSGFNIAILITAVLFFLRFVPLFLRGISAAIFVVLFVLMVGAEASVIRATLMAFIALLALMLGRGYVAKQALLTSLLCSIVYEPDSLLFDVSLHLSFLATAGIVYMSEGLQHLTAKISSRTYREIITTSLAAYLATFPYIMYTFGTISTYALLTNLIVLPLVPCMMLLTFIIIPVAYSITSLASLFGYVDTVLGKGIILVARTVERFPFASIEVPRSLFLTISIYLLGIVSYIFFVHMMHKKNNETLVTKSNEILSEIMTY